MFPILIFAILIPACLAFFLINSSKKNVIRAGLILPIILLTLLIFYKRPEPDPLTLVIYFIWVPVFLVATYVFWRVFRLFKR